jgi:predicted permease
MRRLRVFASRLKGLFAQLSSEHEFDDELLAHIELLTERYIRQGATPTEARAAALRQFGHATQLKEEMHEQRTLAWLDNVLQDTRYALRQVRKSPVFSFTAVLTLTLGIGVNTAIFSMVYAVLLRSLPYSHPQQLTLIWEQNAHRGWYHNIVSAANFNDWSKQNHVFSDMALIDPFITFNLAGSGAPTVVTAARATPNLLSVLGLQPLLGRSFFPEEGRPGSPRVVVLSHAIWAGRYGADRAIIGKQVSLNSENYTVIGVLPVGIDGVFTRDFEGAAVIVSGLDRSDPGRTDHNFIAIARLRQGITLQKAQAEMNAIAARLERQYPDNRDWGVGLVSLHDELVGDSRPVLLILLAAVTLVLLIACANLANLLLVRGMARFREFALRKALGAGGRRLLAQLLTEGLVLSTFGTAAGLLFAATGIRALIAIAPIQTPGIETASLHTAVVLYAAGIACVTTVLFGLVPAFGAASLNLGSALKERGRSSTGMAHTGLRKALVAAELSIALVLAVSAGLMIKTLLYMHHIDSGFRPDQVLALRVPLNDVKYNEKQQSEFYSRLLARLAALPDVESTTISRGVPFFGWDGQGFVTGDNPDVASADMPDANVLAVAPQYFDVLHIPLKKGRLFSEHDTDAGLRVAIVNQALADMAWPRENPIGKRVKVGWTNAPWMTVIGVTGNVRTEGPEAHFAPEIYTVYTQHPWFLTPRDVLIRTRTANPLSIVPEVRDLIRKMDPDQPIADIRTLEAVASQPLAVRNFLTCLLVAFASLALLLAAIGVYGVMSYAVAQRLREMGIRIALGATRTEVLSLVLNDGLRVGATGIVIGILGSIAATRLLSSQLYGVKPTDPGTFVLVAVLLAIVAVSAAYLPASRAASVDPIAVLRDE